MVIMLMDEEIIGRVHGYIQWAADAYWNKKEYEAQKTEMCSVLKQNKNLGFDENKHAIQQLKLIISKRQLPVNKIKVQIYEDIKELLLYLKVHFQNMHAELFVTDVIYAAERVHENTVILNDTVQRQEKILDGLTPETFDELMQHFLFLLEKEQGLQEGINRHSIEMCNVAMRLMRHINYNYFFRLSKISRDRQFHNDHNDIFISAYLLSICSRAIGNVYGIDLAELQEVEESFVNNISS